MKIYIYKYFINSVNIGVQYSYDTNFYTFYIKENENKFFFKK